MKTKSSSCSQANAARSAENFPRCPYCDHLFPNGDELEDFILKPALNRWIQHTCQQFPK